MNVNYKHQRVVILREIGEPNNEHDVIRFVEWLNNCNPSHSTVASRSAASRELWWSKHEDNKLSWADLEYNMRGIIKKKKPTYTKERLTAEKYKELISLKISNKLKLFMIFLWETGIREAEMRNINVLDCNSYNDEIEISIITMKTNEKVYRTIPISLFKEIKKEFDKGEYLFSTSTGRQIRRGYISTEIKKAGSRIGVDVSAHSFRHSWFTNRVELKENLTDLSRRMGHKSAGSTINSYYIGAVN